MFAQLCNPMVVRRRFKLQPLAQEGQNRKSVRRHSWNNLNVENSQNDARLVEAPATEDSDSEDDQENRNQGPDLLETCWDVKGTREDDCQSEPGTEPFYDSIASVSMGQRASSTSTLHEPLRRPPPGVALPPGNRVSLTWALLKKPPHQFAESAAAAATSKKELILSSSEREHIERSSLARRSPKNFSSSSSSSRPSSNSTSSRTNSSSNSRSSNSIKNFGYEIQDVDEFLSKASLQNPANIPVVLACPCVLYQPGTRGHKSGRGGWRQNEMSLPLGMVVNAVFRSHGWLYVHTPHGEAGYVRYRACLPLGILPSPAVSAPGTPAPGAWDTHTDAFPPPPLPNVSRTRRSGTTSVCEGRRNNKTDMEKLRDTVSECGGAGRSRHRHRHRAHRPEAAVDRLFLAAQRSESESVRSHRTRPRSSAEMLLKDAEMSSRRFRSESTNIDSVSVKDSVSQVGVRNANKLDKIKDYQYQIKQNLNNLKPMHRTIALQTDFDDEDSLIKESVSEVGRSKKQTRARGAVSECGGVKSKSRSRGTSALSEVQMKTETLLLIRSDYNSRGRNTLSVSKGDVVVLVSSRLKDWFWVRRTDGCEGFIPAVVAGHGFL